MTLHWSLAKIEVHLLHLGVSRFLIVQLRKHNTAHYSWGIIPNYFVFVFVIQLKEDKQHLYIRTKEEWNSPI